MFVVILVRFSVRNTWCRLASVARYSPVILRERQSVSADTAIRLGKYFGIEPLFWLNLQQAHVLSKAQAENDYSDVAKRAA